jgi:hypothetical protein
MHPNAFQQQQSAHLTEIGARLDRLESKLDLILRAAGLAAGPAIMSTETETRADTAPPEPSEVHP